MLLREVILQTNGATYLVNYKIRLKITEFFIVQTTALFVALKQ